MSSYIYKVLQLFWSFKGNHEADVAPGENVFDIPDIGFLKSALLESYKKSSDCALICPSGQRSQATQFPSGSAYNACEFV